MTLRILAWVALRIKVDEVKYNTDTTQMYRENEWYPVKILELVKHRASQIDHWTQTCTGKGKWKWTLLGTQHTGGRGTYHMSATSSFQTLLKYCSDVAFGEDSKWGLFVVLMWDGEPSKYLHKSAQHLQKKNPISAKLIPQEIIVLQMTNTRCHGCHHP